MKLSQDITSEIVHSDLETLFEHMEMIYLDTPDIKEQRNQVIEGINWKCHITILLSQDYDDRRYTDKVILFTNPRQYIPKTDFRMEIHKRKALMRKIIYENLETTDKYEEKS